MQKHILLDVYVMTAPRNEHGIGFARFTASWKIYLLQIALQHWKNTECISIQIQPTDGERYRLPAHMMMIMLMMIVY